MFSAKPKTGLNKPEYLDPFTELNLRMANVTIVNVDDRDASREATSDLLRREGFAVKDASRGKQALRLVKSVAPRLVLLNVKLPDMDGHEVCRQLKDDPVTAEIPVLLVSASYVSGEGRVEGLESGADAFLVKPVEEAELIATIRALLRLREAEEARRESEARYQLLFEGNSLPTWIVDLQTLGFLAVNEAAVRHYGYSREEFFTKTIDELRASASVPGLKEYLADGLNTIPNASAWQHVTKDGTVLEVELVWHELIYGGRHALLIMAKDVTENRQAREVLQESEGRFRMMADTAPVMIWVSGMDKQYTFFNKRWLDFTGRTMEQEIGMGWAEGIHPEERESCINEYNRAFDAR